MILVSDTSVLIDVQRGGLLEALFALPHEFAVPDVLYDHEMQGDWGEGLVRLGLRVEEVSKEGVANALRYRQQRTSLSVPDSFALALAKERQWLLLTGDGQLRELAGGEDVECHGVLWLLDIMEEAGRPGIQRLHDGLSAERLPFHWGMTMAAYPFWRVVADVTGRLLRLQASASAREVQRRVKEIYGERETVARSARYVLRAFADWGVVVESDKKGRYIPQNLVSIGEATVATWLLEATMFASETSSTDFRSLANSPALFPFQLPRITSDALTLSRRLEVVRHGVGDVLVLVRRPTEDSLHRAGSPNGIGRL